MRNPDRIDIILNLIEKIWKHYPDLRFGQLIENILYADNIFYTEDDELEAKLLAFMKNHLPK
jgi:hypothetical protein